LVRPSGFDDAENGFSVAEAERIIGQFVWEKPATRRTDGSEKRLLPIDLYDQRTRWYESGLRYLPVRRV